MTIPSASRALAVVLLLAGAQLWSMSCGGDDFTSEDVGAGGDGSSSDPTSTASTGGQECVPPADTPCTACVKDSCSEVACACWSRPACLGLFECLNGKCPEVLDDQCLIYCMSTNAEGVSPAVLVMDCRNTLCSGTCPGGGFVLDECERCLYHQCGDKMNQCLAQTPCYNLLVCVKGCNPGDTGCIDACRSDPEFQDANDEFDNIQQCADEKCPEPCG